MGLRTIITIAALCGLVLALAAEPVRAERRVLRLPMMGEIPTLDPGLAEDSSSIEVIEQLFLGLTDFDDETSEVVPELATRWTVGKEGLSYTFHMRKAVWSDGRPVTAHDIVWAVRRNIDPATASPYAYMLYGIRNAEAINTGRIKDPSKVGVEALDDHTVRFTLARPAAYFPAVAGMWTLRPLPRHAIEAHRERWSEPEHMVSNGPYRLVSWERGNKLVLRRNPAYYGAGGVRIPEVHYLIIPESSTGLAMYENGELDMMGGGYLPVPSPDIPRLKTDSVLGRELTIAPRLCTYYYAFNTARPPMDDARVRKAFSAAINRQLLIDKIVLGEQQPATTFTRPPVFGSVPPEAGVGIGYDGDRARAWLAEAGYPGGKGFPQVALMYNTSENHGRIAQAIQQMWRKELNVRVKVENQEWKVYLSTTRRKNGPHIFRSGWCADYPDANNWLMEVFHPTKSTNRVHWNNAEFARVTERAQVAQDPAERKRLYRRAEEILNEEEAVIAPIYFYTSVTLTKPYLNMKLAPLGGNHIRDWHFVD
ncbi:MAG: peptide ABC transporter substrate-binding protein [SAR324 cluster bacterium]|nr:peptide ABC transporter substrate-binding protein [SAR324 cluster bacterium]